METGYDKVDRVIKKYCEETNTYEDLIVRIRMRYSNANDWEYHNLIYETSLPYLFDCNHSWWEGETYVEVVGIIPVSDISPMTFIQVKEN